MNLRVGLLLCTWSVIPMAHAADIVPADFAYGSKVITSTTGAAYRIELPETLYQLSVREDLGDVRVFNAAGEGVPYSLRRIIDVAPTKAALALPIFPIPLGARATMDGVRVTIAGAGSAVNWQATPGAADISINQYIVDGREIASAVTAFQLQWAETGTVYSGHLEIEASEDLGTWRRIVAAAPVANLRAADQSVIQNRVVIPASKSKFWRFSWLGRAPDFSLTGALAEPENGPAEPNRSMRLASGSWDSAKPRELLVDLASHAPVDRVNLALPEINSVVDAEIASRARPDLPWRVVTTARFFRVTASDGEHSNEALQIPVDRDRYWRIRIDFPSSLPKQPPQLQSQWIPDQLTFLAQGQGPFLLAFGSASIFSSGIDFTSLPSNLAISPAALDVIQPLGGESRLSAGKAPFPRNQLVLWTMLIVAVLGLAWMAYRLINER